MPPSLRNCRIWYEWIAKLSLTRWSVVRTKPYEVYTEEATLRPVQIVQEV
jgi:hypothetical protein